MKEQIEIPLSKTKLNLLLLGAIVFLIIGFIGTIIPETFISVRFNSPLFIRTVSIVSVLFFGVCLVNIVRKLFDKNIGLTINNDGIIDNSNNSTVGLINWSDITSIETIKIFSNKLVIIKTNKPEKYISLARNKIHKNSLKSNNLTLGTPLVINPKALKIKEVELEKLLMREFEKRK